MLGCPSIGGPSYIMKKLFKFIKDKFLTFFGDIKVFKYPFWIVYDPCQYQVEGSKLREVLHTLKAGDILCRGYVNYLDGYFIPGKYSHSGIYVGGDTVIHSVAEGVCKCDVLDFLQCDCACIVRPKDHKAITLAIDRAHGYLGTNYDFNFSAGDEALYCHELSARCYREKKITKHIPKLLWGLIKGKEAVYLAESFIESEEFEVVMEVE